MTYAHPPVRDLGDGGLRITLDGEQITGRVWASADGRTLWVRTPAGLAQLTRPQADTAIGAAAAGAEVLAPMPGSVIDVRVDDGQQVTAGQPVVTVEAMKMEHVLTAPADGVVHLSTVAGAQVALDEVLARVVPAEADDTTETAAATDAATAQG